MTSTQDRSEEESYGQVAVDDLTYTVGAACSQERILDTENDVVTTAKRSPTSTTTPIPTTTAIPTPEAGQAEAVIKVETSQPKNSLAILLKENK